MIVTPGPQDYYLNIGFHKNKSVSFTKFKVKEHYNPQEPGPASYDIMNCSFMSTGGAGSF